MRGSQRYFAAKSRVEIGEALVARLQGWAKDGAHDNREEYANAYRHYYGKDNGWGITTGVTRGGAEGELAVIRINRSRALASALLSIIVGPKLSWRPTARNSDSGAAKATSLAINLLEDWWKEQKMNRTAFTGVEQAIGFSQTFVFKEWDPHAGPPLGPNGDRMERQGDIVLRNVLPWDHFVDPQLKSYKDVQGRFLRIYKNRFDLAKQVTRLADGRMGDEAADAILSCRGTSVLGAEEDGKGRGLGEDSDIVPVWYFFHAPSPALPMGRETIFLSADVVLKDGRLSYGDKPSDVPVYRLAASEMFDSPHAWTSFWDTLGAQELTDGIETSLASIITNLGNTIVGYEKGSDVEPTQLAKSFSSWQYMPGGKPPAPIQMAVFPPDALEYKQSVIQDQRQLMGLNDVALGQPDTAQMNAQAFAVLASMAVQQANPFQSAYIDWLSAIGSGILKDLRHRATRERQLKITGKASAHLYSEQSYTGKDLAAIDAVHIDIGNPLEQTPGGRMQILEKLMAIPGVVTNGEQIQQVLETGRLDVATRGMRDELQLISAEYEALSQGEVPPVHTFQNHPLHYRENASPLHNPEAMKNPAVVNAVQTHLDAHYLEYFGLEPGMDPLRLPRQRFLLGQGPEPLMAPPMPGQEQGTGGAGPVGGEAGPDITAGPEMPAPNPAAAAPAPPMPVNPVSGQQFDNQTGGLA